MSVTTEQLEHAAERSRTELGRDIDELRVRLTPREVVGEVVDYARETPLARFTARLGHRWRRSPLPLLVIVGCIGWVAFAANHARRDR